MSGVNVGTAYLEIIPSAKGFAGKLQGEVGEGMAKAGSESGRRFGEGFKETAKRLIEVAALVEVAHKAVDFAKDSISEARESQKVGALTTQVIKSTGGAAKVTAGQVGDLATAISNKTGIDDEAVQSASNLLLTFTNVRNEVGKGNDVFNQATQIATDMGAALGGDPKSSAIQLGKALNDPVKGITALQRVGVSFTKQQKDQIGAMVKSGNTLGAQKIILGELNKEFGGAAAASSTAGEKMSTAFKNFKENIGTALLPALDKTENFLTNRLLPGIQGVIDILFKGDFTKGFREAFNIEEDSPVVGFLFGVRDAAKGAFTFLKTIFDVFRGGAKDTSGLSDGMALLAIRIGHDAHGAFDKAMAVGRRLFDYLKVAVPPIIDSAKKLWPPIREIGKQLLAASQSGGVSTFGLLKTAIAALPGVLDKVGPLLENVAKWMGENKTFVASLVVALTGGITAFKVITGIVKAFTVVQGILNIVMAANPIGIVVIAIAALVAGLIYAYNTSETFRSYVSTAFSVVKIGALTLVKIAVTAFQFLANVWLTVVGVLIDGAANAFGWVPGIGPKLQGVQAEFHKFKDNANASLDGIKKDLDVKINTEQANIALEALHREFLSKGWTVTAQVNTNMVYTGGGKLGPAHAGGGPVSAGTAYPVGDNPDGSWNKTTELFVPSTSGTILNQKQIAGLAGGGIDYDRLAYAMSRVRVNAKVTPSTLDHAWGG